jgi:hypothetical protein
MQIANAIRNLQTLTFTYRGHHRVVEPHTYGIDGKGHKALRAYQVSGTSSSGKIFEFRTFHESLIVGLAVSAQKFSGPRLGYTKNDPIFASIFAQL